MKEDGIGGWRRRLGVSGLWPLGPVVSKEGEEMRSRVIDRFFTNNSYVAIGNYLANNGNFAHTCNDC